MLMIDVCAGLGGASAAMIERGWQVVRVDNDPRFKPEVLADIREWHYTGPRPDLMWFSPPCEEFAREFMPWSRTGVIPDLTLVQACLRIIFETRPRWWVVENVKGAVAYISPLIGRPHYICNPYYLWGIFPDISHVRVASHKEHLSSTRAAERGVIPYALSLALAVAIESSPPLPFLGYY